MGMVIANICANLDFTIRPGDPTSVHRYKRFLADIHSHFGTLDSGRLVMAIRDESDRKKLRHCYRHISGNHNDVSLVLWHGPIQKPPSARPESGPHTRG